MTDRTQPQPPSHPEGVGDDTWLDVIHKMDEVYSQLLRDEVALEQKNAARKNPLESEFSGLAEELNEF